MKLVLYTCCLLLMISCIKEKKEIQKPSFLIGDWVRINNKKGTITYETWHSNFKGLGYTLKEKDTIFKEVLSIITLKDTLFLKVKNVNENPTFFKFTQQTDTSFTCENLKNKFPKKIEYYIENNQLKAVVSVDGFKINFIFNKV